MNETNAELWQSFLTIVLSFMNGAGIAFVVLVIAYVIGFIALRIGQAFKKDIPSNGMQPASNQITPPVRGVNDRIKPPPAFRENEKEHGFVKLSAADELVMREMTQLDQVEYITNKVNIFRGSDTKIELLTNERDFIHDRRINWREV